eukprot:1443988-Pyramimonas_sp.AAC.1
MEARVHVAVMAHQRTTVSIRYWSGQLSVHFAITGSHSPVGTLPFGRGIADGLCRSPRRQTGYEGQRRPRGCVVRANFSSEQSLNTQRVSCNTVLDLYI